MATWIVKTTLDRLHTSDNVSLRTVRKRMKRDAAQWSELGPKYKGVRLHCDLTKSTTDSSFVVTGEGYNLHLQHRDRNGYWPVDALQSASLNDWNEGEQTSDLTWKRR